MTTPLPLDYSRLRSLKQSKIATVPCLFCQTENIIDDVSCDVKCKNCGMQLAEIHPNDKKLTLRFFKKAFWLIVAFCLVMIYYLPR